MASRSVRVSIERRRAGGGMNDNHPSVLPGHELIGLDGLPRPPAAEAVAHYSRFTQIGSFPDHPAEPVPDAPEPPVMDVLMERPRLAPSTGKKTVAVACLGSFLFHAVIVAALLVTMAVAPEDAEEEAGDTVSVIMLGSSDMDQMSAGEESTEPQPEQITADAVQPRTMQPADVKPAEAEAVQPQPTAAQPVETVEAVQPATETVETAQPLQQISREAIVSPEPEVLATQAPAETTVVQPMTASVQPTNAKPEEVQPAETKPVEVQPVEAAQAAVPPTEAVTPVEKPLQQAKPIEKPKDIVKKQPPKAVKVKAGSGGESEQDSKKGSAEGTENAQSNANSLTDGRRTGLGSAAVANYPGKVQSRIRRAVRLSSNYEKGITVRVRLTIGAGGELSSLSVARSSGIPELDEAVTDGVRRAAPFPPLPPEWGKPSWSFTQEVQVTGR
ncbi:cell envelope integrity protein TolA [Rhizobium jaguaris]|uniref:TonB family protein n=1 Tax=Rhizobium jaguaris TaxID=1312183 RepID=A0A387FMR8_9HYPH|nr:TonB family protein [Rhizobium jaguaris]AYG60098.1 TonB family protein [Rhizobium jaguaris]